MKIVATLTAKDEDWIIKKTLSVLDKFCDKMTAKYDRRFSLGYIGNLSANGRHDDRSWRIFIDGCKTPPWAIIGEIENFVTYAPALEKVEARVERLMEDMKLDCSTCTVWRDHTMCRLCVNFSNHLSKRK